MDFSLKNTGKLCAIVDSLIKDVFDLNWTPKTPKRPIGPFRKSPLDLFPTISDLFPLSQVKYR